MVKSHMPKHFSDNKICRHCGRRFSGSIASRYCGDRCHIEASSIKASSGCWEWQRKRNKKTGRAQINPSKGIHTLAARVSFVAFKGAIPAGKFVCHSCDNPGCVNPDHLFLGSPQDNVADMMAKGRQLRGEKNAHAKLTDEDVRAIRKSNETVSALARRYDVNRKTMQCAKEGRTWRHVT